MECSGGDSEGDLSSFQCVNFPAKSSLLTHNLTQDDFKGELTNKNDKPSAAINNASALVYQETQASGCPVSTHRDETAQDYLKRLLLFQHYFQKQQKIEQVLARADPAIVKELMNQYYTFKQKQLQNKKQQQNQQSQRNQPLKSQQQLQQQQKFIQEEKIEIEEQSDEKKIFNSPSTISLHSHAENYQNEAQLNEEFQLDSSLENKDQQQLQAIETEESSEENNEQDSNRNKNVNIFDEKEKKLAQERLVKLLEKIDFVLEKLSLYQDEIRQMSKDLATKITPFLRQNFRNKPYEAVAMAIIFLACRNAQHPLTMKDLVGVNFGPSAKNISQRIIFKCIVSIKKIITDNQFVFYKPTQLVEKICQKINLKRETLETAQNIVQKIDEKNLLMGRSAFSVAGSGVFMSCILHNENKGFEEVSAAANVNKVTLKNMYREIFPFRFEINEKSSESKNSSKNDILTEEQQRNLYQFYIV